MNNKQTYHNIKKLKKGVQFVDDCKFNSGTTNNTISINLFWDIQPQTFMLQEE